METTENVLSKETTIVETILDADNFRFTAKPINPKYEIFWKLYKIQQEMIWTAEEIDLSKDYDDFLTLNPDEQHFIKMVLAFFASSDGIVNFNLRERFLTEIQITEAQFAYGFQLMMENVHCVSEDTLILTDNGYIEIGKHCNKNVKVWNGKQFSNTKINYTGDSMLYEVELTNGMKLKCTPQHKWFVNSKTHKKKVVFTEKLKINDMICSYDLPVIDTDLDDNIDLTDITSVPINSSVNNKIRWLEKVFEANGYLEYKKMDDEILSTLIKFLHKNSEFLKNVQLMLSTLGINSQLNYGDYSILYILIPDVVKLTNLGFSSDRAKIVNTIIPDDELLIRVKNITLLEGIHKTYCFTEPYEHAGIFNGILTGQSEVYADMLSNIIKNPDERNLLFNAMTTIPTVKKMSDWAMKWINGVDSIGQRVMAFAIVEGVFFSGAFAAIFWLKKQRSNGKLFMEGLIHSNKLISRDEATHVNFATALYSFVVHRVSKEDTINMFKEANDISKEFIIDSIKCQLIGMSPESMIEYINYVSDRLLVMLGYEKLYNAKNPFPWMDTIGLQTKGNFFETRPDEYQRAYNEDNKDNKDFKILEDF